MVKQKASKKKPAKSNKAKMPFIRAFFVFALLTLPISILFGVPFIASIVPSTVGGSPPILFGGDVNHDGKIDSIDALFVLQHIVGTRQLSSNQLLSADVNKDGKVDMIDAMFILQYTAGTRQLFQNWVTKEHDFNHTGISNSADVLKPTIEWKKSGVVGTYDEWGGVIVVDGVIYTVPMTTETNMYAIDTSTHNIKWSKNIGQTNAPALYYNHVLYVLNMAGNLFALYERDSSEKWSRNVFTAKNPGAMTISEKDNAIFVSQGNPLRLYSYDLDNGNEKWNVSLPWGIDTRSGCAITFGTIYKDGVVYLSGYSCMDTDYLAAYSSNNGTQLWETKPAGVDENDKRSIYIWDSDLLINNNILYIGIHNINLNYNIIAVYPNNGSLKWGKKTGNTLTTPKIYNDVLWTVSVPRVYGLNPDTGDIIYNSPLDDDVNVDVPFAVSSMTPVLGINYFYFTTTLGSHNKLYAFDYNGNKVWSYDFGSIGLFSQGALVNGELYITADDTSLYIFKG